MSACWYTTSVAASLLDLPEDEIVALCEQGLVNGVVSDLKLISARQQPDGTWRVPVEWLGPRCVARSAAEREQR